MNGTCLPVCPIQSVPRQCQRKWMSKTSFNNLLPRWKKGQGLVCVAFTRQPYGGEKKNHDFLRVHIEIVIFYQKSLSQENHLVKKVTTILSIKQPFTLIQKELSPSKHTSHIYLHIFLNYFAYTLLYCTLKTLMIVLWIPFPMFFSL